MEEVCITDDVYFACMSHALTTEREEVMGLLLGDVGALPGVSDPSGGPCVSVWAVSLLARSDRRKDRVEISPEQLTQAAQYADHVTAQCGRRTRVVGWYHSHPHITVHPSHVDLATQQMYQLMDASFVGLIFSCFNNDGKRGRVQVIAFRAGSSSSAGGGNGVVAAVPGAAKPGEMSDVHSRLEEHALPLRVVHAPCLAGGSLCKLVEMQELLQREESAAYHESLKPAVGQTECGAIRAIHNSAVYSKALCRLMEYGSVPVLNVLREEVNRNQANLKALQERLKDLKQRRC
eukprot:m51a1_g9528 putative lys-63-specific deubiquitinase brcc36 (291) ;mRNA; f:770440-771615